MSTSASSHTRSSSARPDDQRTRAVFEDVLDRHDLARHLVAAGEHDVQRLVEDDLLAALERVEVDLGAERHPHLAAARQHVDRAVVVAADHHAVRRRRLGELVDLFAQRGDVLARLTQRVRQLLVLRHRLGELALRLEQPLLERADALRCVLQLAPQRQDLFLEELRLLAQLRELGVVCREPTFVLGLLHEGSPPFASDLFGTLPQASRRNGDMHTAHRHRFAPFDRMRCFTGLRRVNCGHRRRDRAAPQRKAQRGHEGLDRPGSLHR